MPRRFRIGPPESVLALLNPYWPSWIRIDPPEMHWLGILMYPVYYVRKALITPIWNRMCNIHLAPRKYWRVWFQYSIVEVEHVQDFQFWHFALWRTHYNGCHIQIFSFPCYGHWIPDVSVICDEMHGNSLGIYPLPCILYTPFWSTTRQCIWFGPRI